MPAHEVDGSDFFAVYDVAREVIERARGGGGPSLVHVKLNRYFGHFEGDAMTYRAPDEVSKLRANKDPLKIFRQRVTEAALLEGEELDQVDDEIKSMVDQVTVHGQGGADADRGRPHDRRLRPLLRGASTCRRRAIAKRSTRRSVRRWSATRASSSWARTSPAAWARRARTTPGAGRLGVTKGLMPQFGRERVLDTPITESAFIGAAVGAAATGLRPVAELMFVDFMGVCFDQIYNQAAKFRYMFGGKAVTPVVIRTMYGAGFRAASQHSQCLYPLFTHIPGLKVVLPSNAYEAKGLLIQAIRDDDPVIFFEHKAMYDEEVEVPDDAYTIPFGEANVTREGDDVTIVAFGRMVNFSNQAADKLAKDGISCTVVDPRTTSPLDRDTILETASETGRRRGRRRGASALQHGGRHLGPHLRELLRRPRGADQVRDVAPRAGAVLAGARGPLHSRRRRRSRRRCRSVMGKAN